MDQYKQALVDLTHLQTKLDSLQIWKHPQLHTQIQKIKQSIDQIAEIVDQEQQNEKEYQRMKQRGQFQKQIKQNEEDDFLNRIQKISPSSIRLDVSRISADKQDNPIPQFYQQIQKSTIAEKPSQKQQKKIPDKIKFSAFKEYKYNLDVQTQKEIQEAMQRYEMIVLKQPIFTEKGDQEVCAICYENYFVESENQEEISVTLLCKHSYHWGCLQPMLKDEFLKCPVCNKIYGIIQGDQPDGTMEVKIIKQSCSGYKCDTIQITYTFNNGVKNGRHYFGTTRVAYLPNNNQGQFILNLLKRAFDQKLIFTIGTSITTGQQNCTVWNGIHHKTSMSGGAYGYPDPTYIDRVLEELKQRGIR